MTLDKEMPMIRMIALLTVAAGLAAAPARVQDPPEVKPELRVSPTWLARNLDSPQQVVLHVGFDPKTAPSTRPTYWDGHIPGARPVEWEEIVRNRGGIPNELPPAEDLVAWVRSLGIFEGDRIILYDTGSGLEAARAYFTLDYLGLGGNAAVLDGQWSLWRSLDLPVQRMPVEDVEPSGFVPKLRPEIRVDLRSMQDLSFTAELKPGAASILDARMEEEFDGLQGGPGIRRSGHIPGAVNLCWRETVLSDSAPMHRSDEELRKLFSRAGVRPDRPLTVYCRTGVQAAQLYLVAKALGYQVRLYDGSYFEWSRAEGTPVRGIWANR